MADDYRDVVCVHVCSAAHSCLFVTPCSIGFQAPLSMEFSRQEY